MTVAHAYTLLLEAAALVASFAMLWLSVWLRDRQRQHHHPAADFASDQQDGAKVIPLVLAGVGSGTRLTIKVAGVGTSTSSGFGFGISLIPSPGLGPVLKSSFGMR